MFLLYRTLHTRFEYAPITYNVFQEALWRARRLPRPAWISWRIVRVIDGVTVAQSKEFVLYKREES